MPGNIKLLDCTLRDGGYLDNWQYTPEHVQKYLNSLCEYGMDIAEVGFRYNIKNENYGICAYCPDKFLESLDIPENLQIAVMIKAEQLEDSTQLHKLFTERENSKIDIVRVAIHHEKAHNCGKILETLKAKGYKTTLNLTKLCPDFEIKNTLNFDYDILYFADTFGRHSPENVKRIIDEAKTYYDCSLGFHGHDNQGLALKNTLTAIKSGVTYADSTIKGAGKGAGNLKTEDIAKEVKNGRTRLHILQNRQWRNENRIYS